MFTELTGVVLKSLKSYREPELDWLGISSDRPPNSEHFAITCSFQVLTCRMGFGLIACRKGTQKRITVKSEPCHFGIELFPINFEMRLVKAALLRAGIL